MFNVFTFVVFVIIYLDRTSGKIFNNCELAKTLMNKGVPRNEIPNWVCIAKHESEFNTEAINGDTGDYGIFQISHLYWCNDGDTPGKECQVTCKALLNDDISDDIKCARQIYAETEKLKGCGYCAWVGYNQHCANRNNEDYITGCNI